MRRNILITGASSGLGEGMAREFAKMGRNLALCAYAASKAALATLTEGIRADLMRTPIRVTTIYTGYIRSEINEKVKNRPFIVDTETGCRAMVAAIERETPEAYVPRWPWSALGFLMKRMPLRALARMT